MRGHLVIHIGGYKQVQSHASRIYVHGTDSVIVPDRLIPAETYAFGTPGWIEDGWAVGDNPRDRFCKWAGAAPMRRFHNYDEAVAHIHQLRHKRKRPNEVYTLVYFLPVPAGILNCRPISSMDDIEAFEREIDEVNYQHQQALAERKKALSAEYPELEFIAQHSGRRNAMSLSLLLKSINENGIDNTKENTPRSAFYRGVKELRRLGLIDVPKPQKGIQ